MAAAGGGIFISIPIPLPMNRVNVPPITTTAALALNTGKSGIKKEYYVLLRMNT
jgi:hypothetical protein